MRGPQPGGPCPLDMGETMRYARGFAHHHRVPHLQRRWATLSWLAAPSKAPDVGGGLCRRGAGMSTNKTILVVEDVVFLRTGEIVRHQT